MNERIEHDVDVCRRDQIQQWGSDDCHTPLEWSAILGKRQGKLCEAAQNVHYDEQGGDYDLVKDDSDKYRTRLVEVATVAIAAIDQFDSDRKEDEEDEE